MLIEVVRAGTIFAHDGKQYSRYAHRVARKRGGAGMTGQALENAIAALRATHPEYVDVA